MSEHPKDQEDLKSYADGWIMERKHTDAPGFLKLAFPLISLGGVAYMILQGAGDVHNSSRGHLVEAFNKVSKTSPVMTYTVAGLLLIYAVIVIAFTFRTFKED